MKFKTNNNLKFNVGGISPFPGYAAFSVGGVVGFFKINKLTVDVMIAEITKGEHLVDSIQWFDEISIKSNLVGTRIFSVNDPVLSDALQRHGFIMPKPGTLFKES